MRFIVDGDVYVYHACHRCVEEVVFGRTAAWSVDLDRLELALEGTIRAHCRQVHERLGLRTNAEVVVALSDPDRDANWRRAVLPTYKGNRRPLRWPLGYDHATRWLPTRFRTEAHPTLEADDVCGIRATEVPQAAVLSTDKDMLTIPRYVVRPRWPGPELDVTLVDQDTADTYHLVQTLAGDRVDDYPGCPKVGPVRAKRALDVPKDEQWGAVVALYEKAGLAEADALVQARVARILRHGEYNFITHKVTLWTPNI